MEVRSLKHCLLTMSKSFPMKNFLTILIFSLVIVGVLPAQTPVTSHQQIVNGFSSKITGDDFTYHSSIPAATSSLLVRATDGTSLMEWETAAVPANPEADTLIFVWLAGIGSSPGLASFNLAVNGEHWFNFLSDGSDRWLLTSAGGATLSFSSDMTDQHGDRFGFMYLKVPSGMLRPGEPLRLRVTGAKSGKTSWYMTFMFPMEDGIKLKAYPALIAENGKEFQMAVAGILHFGETAPARIYIGNKLISEQEIHFGYNYLNVKIPYNAKAAELKYRLEAGGKTWKGSLKTTPVRKWKVNFVQHSHTDIGYTRPQTEILAEHLRYIDYALDYCDLTETYPDEARFRWTCEVSWAVDEYLKCRPERQKQRLVQRIREGRIEVTGMYLNFGELPDEQVLAASLQPLKRFSESGIKVTTAMQNDVNGVAWSLCDYYAGMGVKYLNMGTHGHRALICFDKPTLFRWESPSGKRMLAFRAEHYMLGNTRFKIHTGDFNAFEESLLAYLEELEKKGYAYNRIAIQHSGFQTDNSPPSTAACELIRQWNLKYTWPRLQTAIVRSFFEEMDSLYGNEFQVIRGAWPDWWTDGFGASAREVDAVRQAQADLIANTGGLTMAAMGGARLPEGIGSRISEANNALLFYTEHTLGFHASVREPFNIKTMEQRQLKESYAWEAGRRARMLGEETMGLLQDLTTREQAPTLMVYNTLSWKRSGLLTVYIDHQILPRYTGFSITDHEGNRAQAQPLEHHSDGTYWAIWVRDVPAFGYKKYSITTDETAFLPGIPEELPGSLTLENDWYQVKFDTTKAAIASLTDKKLKRTITDSGAEHLLGEFIYELPDNREQMESFRLTNVVREGLAKARAEGYTRGAVWNSVKFRGNTRAANCAGCYSLEVRLFNTMPRIDLVYAIEKKLVTDPEGIYIALPLSLEHGNLSFDVQGGIVRAGIDQIPGSANDWNTVQNFARLAGDSCQIVVSPVGAPLMQFGGINTGRYRAGALPESGHIYGWPMNNYWTTNFNADQHGGHAWTYSITGLPGNSITDATRFGWSNRVPFLTRVLPGGGEGGSPWQGSWLGGWPDNILLISALPEAAETTAILHVRETEGKNTTLTLQPGNSREILSLTEVDVTGQVIPGGSATLAPFESKFFLVKW